MVHLGILDADEMPAEMTGWSNPAPARSRTRVMTPRFEPLETERHTQLRYAQQMLVAACLASGAIVVVAAVMMLKFL